MEPTPTIAWEITPDGELKYQVQGVSGSNCQSLTAGLDALGEVVATELTPEYYQSESDPLLATPKTQVKTKEVL